MRSASYVGIIATGLTVVIIAGGNDLSTGAVVGLTAMLASRLIYMGLPIFAVLLLCCLAGLVCGLINGYLITRFKDVYKRQYIHIAPMPWHGHRLGGTFLVMVQHTRITFTVLFPVQEV